MEQQTKILIGLKKARSSLDRIIQKIEKSDGECFSIIQQNLSIIGLLKSANVLMLERHIDAYIQQTKKKSSPQQLHAMKAELIRILQTAQRK